MRQGASKQTKEYHLLFYYEDASVLVGVIAQSDRSDFVGVAALADVSAVVFVAHYSYHNAV